MRVVHVIVALAIIGLGVVFSALNADPVVIDLYVARFELPLGVGLLLAMLSGALLGGLAVVAGVVWPLRNRLRKARRETTATPPVEPMAPLPPPRP